MTPWSLGRSACCHESIIQVRCVMKHVQRAIMAKSYCINKTFSKTINTQAILWTCWDQDMKLMVI